MGTSVNLSNRLIMEAKIYSKASSRSVAKQIEHWAKIGRVAEENPDLTYVTIHAILLGMEDMNAGNVEDYDPNLL